MSAKSYTNIRFDGNIRITSLLLKKIYSYFCSGRVLCPFARIFRRYGIWGNVENLLRQTLYELVLVIFTPSCDTRGFSCNLIGIYSEFKLSTP